MKRVTSLLLLLFLISINGYSQTSVSGSIFSSTNWTTSGSPYIVSGNLVVFTAATLTIDPGVVVKFNSGASIEMRGTLTAIGAPGDSIVFTSNLSSPGVGSWNGIKAIWTSSPSAAGHQITMNYVKGMYATNFIDMDVAYNGPYTFKNCYFAYNNVVNYDGGAPSAIWENCKFVSNNLGLQYCQFYSRVSKSSFINNVNGVNGIANIDTCLFTNNTGTAVTPYGSTIGCTIKNNNIGVSSTFNAVNNTFINNTVTDNTTGVEIGSYFNGDINFTGNTICNNTAFNIKRFSTFAANDADLSGNCWCSTDSAAIRAKIYDGYNNSSFGIVSFMPIAAACASVSLGIDHTDVLKSIEVVAFPNPFNSELKIFVNNSEPAEIIIYDITSRKIVRLDFVSSVIINTEQLANGIYIYQVRNENNILGKGKLIKK